MGFPALLFDGFQIRKSCIDLTGDLVSGVLLSRILDLFLEHQVTLRGGRLWLVRSYQDWYKDLRLTPEALEAASDELIEKGLLLREVYGDLVYFHVNVFRSPDSPLAQLRTVSARFL